MSYSPPAQRQHGAVLILVLWFIMLITLLVATLASEVRLAAKAVFYNQTHVASWNNTLKALHLAQMEIMLQRMPPDKEEAKKSLNERTNPFLLFNGRKLNFSYPAPPGVTVRAYDHAGRINLHNLTVDNLRDLLRKQIGEDDIERLDSLQQAWEDWKDADDLKRMNGAEKDYYEKLDPPYRPRNGQLQTIDEILLIKGFDEVFKDMDLSQIFTIYGGSSRVNPNFASAEVLRLLPGVTEENLPEIISLRSEKELKNFTDLNKKLQPNDAQKLSKWLEFNKSGSNIYSIAIQTDHVEDTDTEDKEIKSNTKSPGKTNKEYAFMVTVQARGPAIPAKILKVEPYARLPSMSISSITTK